MTTYYSMTPSSVARKERSTYIGKTEIQLTNYSLNKCKLYVYMMEQYYGFNNVLKSIINHYIKTLMELLTVQKFVINIFYINTLLLVTIIKY